MFPIRQILRVGARLTLGKDPGHLKFPLTTPGKLVADTHRYTFVRTNANLCEPQQEVPKEENKQPLGTIGRKYRLIFTCKRCTTRNDKTISKLAYEKGVVIVRCDGCKNNHLIADNLGWWAEFKGKMNIEKLLAERGEVVRKIENYVDGYIEAVPYTALNQEQETEAPGKEPDENGSETAQQTENVATSKKT